MSTNIQESHTERHSALNSACEGDSAYEWLKNFHSVFYTEIVEKNHFLRSTIATYHCIKLT